MLALVIIRGYHIWPGIFLGAFSGNATAYIEFSDLGVLAASLFSGTMNGIGDVLCIVLAVYFIKKYAGTTNIFQGMVTFWQFLIFGVAFGPFISALFGVGSLTITGIMPVADAPLAFFTWLIGDSVGALLIAPVILAFYFPSPEYKLKSRSMELVAFIIIICFISVVELSPTSKYSLVADSVFLMIPLLLWSIFRFGRRISYMLILYFFSISLYLTTKGYGIFTEQVQLFSLLQMQMYFMVVSSSVFIIGAMLQEENEVSGDFPDPEKSEE